MRDSRREHNTARTKVAESQGGSSSSSLQGGEKVTLHLKNVNGQWLIAPEGRPLYSGSHVCFVYDAPKTTTSLMLQFTNDQREQVGPQLFKGFPEDGLVLDPDKPSKSFKVLPQGKDPFCAEAWVHQASVTPGLMPAGDIEVVCDPTSGDC